MKHIRYKIEYGVLFCILGLFKILPWRTASNSGGTILRVIGPRLAASRKARRNIERALPMKTKTEVDSILNGMWDNLGRLIAEYPHLPRLAQEHTDIHDPDGVLETLRDDGKPAILIGAHIGNWEILPLALLRQKNLVMHPVYRAPNNPYVDALLHRFRSHGGDLKPYDKSKRGMIGLSRAMAAGEHIGMLIDQKYNEGVEADFFGHPAMTATAFIDLCQRYDCPLVPGYAIRQPNGQFSFTMMKPLDLTQPKDVILKQAHHILEEWIKQTPEQWLWLHRRWKED